MSALVSKDSIIEIVRKETSWMVEQRMNKLQEELHSSMSISPFLLPILYDLHHANNFAELGELLLAGHLMIGHFTSFGKLIDEKVLPKVWGTKKLDAKFRDSTTPFKESCFNDIDHLVPRIDAKPVLLSLKSSRWTINLSAAKELNTAFYELLERHLDEYDEIIVGVFNGTQEGLSDKYDILRGINRGKVHDVKDITSHVKVLAGRHFWSWMNGGEMATQDWILDGILEGLRDVNCREACRELLVNYATAFNRSYEQHLNQDGTINWYGLLSEING